MFSHLPPLKSIKVFESAARLGSFKAAAEELHVTPTAVSHQISNLEDKLGVMLFDRKTRSIHLTKGGEMLALASHQALEKLSSSIEAISHTQSVLRLTTTHSFAALWLVPRLPEFQNQHPEIKIEIQTSETLEDLHKTNIDLAIRYGCMSSLDKQTIELTRETFEPYVSPVYLEQLTSLSDARLIETHWKNADLPEVTWKQWINRFGHEQPLTSLFYFDQEQYSIQAAMAGQGIALVSSILTQLALKQGWLQKYCEECSLPGYSYYLVTSPSSQKLEKVLLFKQWLIQELSVYP